MPTCALSGLLMWVFPQGTSSPGKTARGLACGYGQIVVDGNLIKDYSLFAIERTTAA
jgi:hypothetical protein